MSKWSISGAIILTPEETIEGANIIIQDSIIERITETNTNNTIKIDMQDNIITPGLINGHDHLLGTYYPKVGNGPYENWLPWDNDLKSSPIYAERQQIDNSDLYLLGSYRNLIAGTTSVSDHIPHFVNQPFLDMLPVNVIRDYALAHSIASFALAWGDGIEEEYRRANTKGIPFITHISEGFDSETIQDVKVLDQKGGLGEYSVLVHGLAFSDEDIKLIKKRNASVVWCADSNLFMFNRTTNIKKIIDNEINVCIGTDSPMSGGKNLLSEIKFDKIYYKEVYNKELPDDQIIRMVTINPARAFRLKNRGTIEAGQIADFVVFKYNSGTPYKSIISAELKDIHLVVIDGKPVYGNYEYRDIFDSLKIKYQEVKIDGVDKVIIGDLIGLMQRISRAVGFKKEFPFLPIEFDF